MKGLLCGPLATNYVARCLVRHGIKNVGVPCCVRAHSKLHNHCHQLLVHACPISLNGKSTLCELDIFKLQQRIPEHLCKSLVNKFLQTQPVGEARVGQGTALGTKFGKGHQGVIRVAGFSQNNGVNTFSPLWQEEKDIMDYLGQLGVQISFSNLIMRFQHEGCLTSGHRDLKCYGNLIIGTTLDIQSLVGASQWNLPKHSGALHFKDTPVGSFHIPDEARDCFLLTESTRDLFHYTSPVPQGKYRLSLTIRPACK